MNTKMNTSFGGIDAIHISFTATVHFASSNTAASRTIIRLSKTIDLRLDNGNSLSYYLL
jgi:hypothetical protein